MNKKYLFLGLLHAAGVAVYTLLVALLMTNVEKWGSKIKAFWAPAVFLTLLTLSVAVVGSLIFARPALWALNGQKKEALQFLLFTLGWLAIFVIIAFTAFAFLYQ